MSKFLQRDNLYYLASPYTHNLRSVEKRRLKKISKIAGLLLLKKIHGIYPISSSASISKEVNITGAFGAWEELDLLYVRRCDGVIVADMDGWEESVGVQAELVYAISQGKPIFILNSQLLLEKNILRVKEIFTCPTSLKDGARLSGTKA